MYCLKCGYKIPAGALFCPNCGAKVQAASPAQPSAVPSGTAQPETDAQLDAGSSEQNEQSTAQTRQEPEGQPDAVPSAGPSVPQSAQNNAQPAGDSLAAIVGKHADYYLAEFKKIDAGQKTQKVAAECGQQRREEGAEKIARFAVGDALERGERSVSSLSMTPSTLSARSSATFSCASESASAIPPFAHNKAMNSKNAHINTVMMKMRSLLLFLARRKRSDGASAAVIPTPSVRPQRQPAR